MWLTTAPKQLNLLTSQGQNFWVFLKMTLLILPNLMAIIAPVALLIATLHTVHRANSDSELIVVSASGMTVWRFARPLLLLAFLVSLGLAVVSFYVMPWSLQALKSYIVKVRTDLISQVLLPGQFTSPEKQLTFHIRDRSIAGELLGIVMQDSRDKSQTMSYLAERGQLVKQDGNSFLVMQNGHILRRDLKKDGSQIVKFDRYVINLSRFGPKNGKISYKPRERYLSQLINPEPGDSYFKRHPGKFRSELHERFAGPLYPIVFVMVVVALMGQAQTTRQNRIQSLITAFGLAAGARLLGLAATNLLTLNGAAVVLVYGVPVTAIGLAAWAAQVRMAPRKKSRFAEGLERGFERFSLAVRRPFLREQAQNSPESLR